MWPRKSCNEKDSVKKYILKTKYILYVWLYTKDKEMPLQFEESSDSKIELENLQVSIEQDFLNKEKWLSMIVFKHHHLVYSRNDIIGINTWIREIKYNEEVE